MEATFSFGPSGTFSLFNAGVAYYILARIPFKREYATMYVISGGALGLSLLTHSSPEAILESAQASAKIMGGLKAEKIPPLVISATCRRALESFFPLDAHLILADRVQVGLTHFPSLQPYVVRGAFENRSALFDALMASSYIPGYFLNFAKEPYKNFIDGAFSHNYCKRPERAVVITVSKNECSDVYLCDKNDYHFNLLTEEQYMSIFWQGVEAASKYHDKIIAKLQVNGMIA